VQLWAEEEDLNETFIEIAELAKDCKFSDCRHEGEPGCAIQAALEQGIISAERYDSYLHLKKELAFLQRRKMEKSNVERAHEKEFSKMVKRVMKGKNKMEE
jgi:ribosome biogenesis GTPase